MFQEVYFNEEALICNYFVYRAVGMFAGTVGNISIV
jgi:hypothetical protein